MDYTPTGQESSLTERFFERVLAFSSERSRVEDEICRAMMCDPVRGKKAAREVGIHADHFEQPDLQLVFTAATVASNRADAVAIAKTWLREKHFWDDTQVAGNAGSMRWSDASLAAFAAWFNPTPTAMVNSTVCMLGRQLMDLIARERDVRACLDRASKLLSGDLLPSASPLKPARLVVVNMPKGRAA